MTSEYLKTDMCWYIENRMSKISTQARFKKNISNVSFVDLSPDGIMRLTTGITKNDAFISIANLDKSLNSRFSRLGNIHRK